MKNFIALTAVLFGLIFFTPDSSNATVLTIANSADINQANECYDCSRVEQINISLIFQTILLPHAWLVSNSAQLLADTANFTDIIQDNVCEEPCSNVAQINDTILHQEIHLPNEIIVEDIPNTGSALTEFIINDVLNIEANICFSCIDVEQINATKVEQYFEFTDPLLLSTGSIIRNEAVIHQMNYCRECSDSGQINIAIIYQNIQALSEPSTIFLFSASLGLIGWRIKKQQANRLF